MFHCISNMSVLLFAIKIQQTLIRWQQSTQAKLHLKDTVTIEFKYYSSAGQMIAEWLHACHVAMVSLVRLQLRTFIACHAAFSVLLFPACLFTITYPMKCQGIMKRPCKADFSSPKNDQPNNLKHFQLSIIMC